MAHPYNSSRDHKVQHSRVGSMTKGYASGGGVHSDEKSDKRLVRKMVKETALKLHGGSVGSRSDKPNRAAGGEIKSVPKSKKGTTVINVFAGGEKAAPMMPPPLPPMPPKPPMAGPPPGGMPPPGGPPPGLGGPPMPGGPGMMPPPPMRARGGKVAKRQDGGALSRPSLKELTGSVATEGERRSMKELEGERRSVPIEGERRSLKELEGSSYSGRLKPNSKGITNIGSGEGYKKGGRAKRASGGAVSDASKGKTPVQPQNMKETELKNTGRGSVVTK